MKHDDVRQLDLRQSITTFVGSNPDYYIDAFEHILRRKRWFEGLSFNGAAALFGPAWAAGRGLWGFFACFVVLELITLVELGRGLWGDFGADQIARANRLESTVSAKLALAEAAVAAGDSQAAAAATNIAANLQTVADRARQAADAAAAGAINYLLMGMAMLLGVKLAEGFLANQLYESQYCRWRSNKATPSGFSIRALLIGGLLIAVTYTLTGYRFTINQPLEFLTQFPGGKDFFQIAAHGLDWTFSLLHPSVNGMTGAIRSALLNVQAAIETALVNTPWPVTMLIILVAVWRTSGLRGTILCAAAISYFALLGMWELTLQTVAMLIGPAFFCALVGIPLGIAIGRSHLAYRRAQPVLDFFEAIPAFVYLIPAVIFLGSGQPPGFLATIAVGLPPIIALTAAGIRAAPMDLVNAALTFGANGWQLLRSVQLPAATPLIVRGVRRMLLMCLSMVAVSALIGARGLGATVIDALGYATNGQGMLGGLAILICALLIDRLVRHRASTNLAITYPD